MPKLSDISNKMGLWCFFGSVWLVCYMVGFCSVVDFFDGRDGFALVLFSILRLVVVVY